MTSTREQILCATSDLLENQGYHATGLNEIVQASGAPKGSIYYYFPGGKEEIIAEAVLLAGRRSAERTREHLAGVAGAAPALRSFIETIAHHVEASGFRAGGPLTIVASEAATTSERINQACRTAYETLRAAFEEKLLAEGYPSEPAARLATTLLAAVEGGIILSRTHHTGDPLRAVAIEVERLLRLG